MSLISAFKKYTALYPFIFIIICFECLLMSSAFLWGSKVSILLFLIFIGLVFLMYRRLVCGEKTFNKLLFYTSLSFLLYGVFQSPVFAQDAVALQIVYFVLKFGGILAALFFFRYRGFCNLFSYLILFGFLLDSLFIIDINQGFAKTSTEYFSILESALILVLLSSWFEREKSSAKNEAKTLLPVLYVVAHLANYWGAGFAKLQLNGGVLAWLNNETMANLKRAELWRLPMELYSEAVTHFPFIDIIQYWGNIAVLLGQSLSILAPLMPVLLAPLTVFYDLFHVLVGLLAGVFFYKWIYVNILILAFSPVIVKTLRSYSFTRKAILSFLVIISYYTTSVVHLGWYETRQGNLIHAYGTDIHGNEQKLHTQFFGSAAFSMTNKTIKMFKHHHINQMGTPDYDLMILAETCSLPLHNAPNYMENRERLSKFTQRFLGERSVWNKLMIAAQPYHILIPHWDNRNTLFGNPLVSIRFELRNYCFDSQFDLYRDEQLDEFIVRINGAS